MKKHLLQKFILLLLCLLLALPCAAAEEGSITLQPEPPQGGSLGEISASLCLIAEFGEGQFSFAKGFEEAGFALEAILNAPNEANTKTVLAFIQKNNLPVETRQSSKEPLSFKGLKEGLYLLFCQEEQGLYFAPFFLTLPTEQNGALNYHAIAAPKLSENTSSNKSIYLVKKWNDKENAAGKRPDKIKVELQKDSSTIQTAILSAQTGWAHTFKNLPKSGRYTIWELPVEGYRSQCNGDADNGFVLTNTLIEGKLPQTGQYWWPILILAIAGIGVISLGFLERGRKDEKKSK